MFLFYFLGLLLGFLIGGINIVGGGVGVGGGGVLLKWFVVGVVCGCVLLIVEYFLGVGGVVLFLRVVR